MSVMLERNILVDQIPVAHWWKSRETNLTVSYGMGNYSPYRFHKPRKGYSALYTGTSRVGGPSNNWQNPELLSSSASFASTWSKNSLRGPPVSMAGWPVKLILRGRVPSKQGFLYMAIASFKISVGSIFSFSGWPVSFLLILARTVCKELPVHSQKKRNNVLILCFVFHYFVL